MFDAVRFCNLLQGQTWCLLIHLERCIREVIRELIRELIREAPQNHRMASNEDYRGKLKILLHVKKSSFPDRKLKFQQIRRSRYIYILCIYSKLRMSRTSRIEPVFPRLVSLGGPTHLFPDPPRCGRPTASLRCFAPEGMPAGPISRKDCKVWPLSIFLPKGASERPERQKTSTMQDQTRSDTGL